MFQHRRVDREGRHPAVEEGTGRIGHAAVRVGIHLVGVGQVVRAEDDVVQPEPLPVTGVLGLAAICDLDSFRIGPPDTCHAAVDLLLQGSPDAVPGHYADASPQRRLPLNVRQALVQGEDDDTVAVDSVRRYVQAALVAGDAAKLWALPDAGHFDVVVATPTSEPALRAALAWLLE